MNDILNIDELKNALKDFAEVRDWQKFHNPKNLAMALAVETSELVEIFQWLSDEEAKKNSRCSCHFRKVFS